MNLSHQLTARYSKVSWQKFEIFSSSTWVESVFDNLSTKCNTVKGSLIVWEEFAGTFCASGLERGQSKAWIFVRFDFFLKDLCKDALPKVTIYDFYDMLELQRLRAPWRSAERFSSKEERALVENKTNKRIWTIKRDVMSMSLKMLSDLGAEAK